MKTLIDKLEESNNALKSAIFNEMEIIARQMDLDEMVIHHFGKAWRRNGKEVESKQLDELEQLCFDKLKNGVGHAIWIKELGWIQ